MPDRRRMFAAGAGKMLSGCLELRFDDRNSPQWLWARSHVMNAVEGSSIEVGLVTTAPASAPRIEWVDVAKGIGITLVVLAHMSIPHVLSKYILSFLMPLFFFLSGYVFSWARYPRFTTFFRRRIKTLLIPYFFWSSVMMLCSCLMPVGVPGHGELNISSSIQGILLGNGGHTQLWFVACLFVTELVAYPLLRWTDKRPWLALVVLAGSSAVGYVLSLKNIVLPWCGSVMFTALVFYAVGYQFKKRQVLWPMFVRGPVVRWGLLAVAATLSLIFSRINDRVDLSSNIVGEYFYFYIAAFAGSLLVVIGAVLIPWKKALKFLGVNTLTILAMHIQAASISCCLVAWISGLPIDRLDQSLLVKGLQRLVALLVLLASILLVGRFLPWFVGTPNRNLPAAAPHRGDVAKLTD